jgi:hypothetical protein
MQVEMNEAMVTILTATVFRAEQDLANWQPHDEEEEEAKQLGEQVWWAADELVKGWRNALIDEALAQLVAEGRVVQDGDMFTAVPEEECE